MAMDGTAWMHKQLARGLEELQHGRPYRARSIAEDVRRRYPDDVNGMRFEADVARLEGRLDQALEHYIVAVRHDPSHLPTLDQCFRLAAALDQMDRAVQAAEVSVVADPTDAQRQLRLGRAYFGTGQLQESLGHARLAQQLDPASSGAFGLEAAVFLQLDEIEACARAARRAIELDPGNAEALVNLSTALNALGDAPGAIEMRRRAAEAAPDDPRIAFYTKDLSVATAGDPRIASLEAQLDDPTLSVDARVLGGLAVAKLLDDAGETRRAAEHLIRANAAKAAQLDRQDRSYHPQQEEQFQAAVIERFDVSVIEPVAAPPPGPVPIVLLGLPRSGKSLLEARLAVADDTKALGERSVVFALIRRYEELVGARFPRGVQRLTAEARDALAQELRVQIGSSGGAVVLTSAVNPLFAGLFVLCDPRTVLVASQRDPRDLLLANFQQWFHNQPFAWRPDHLVHRASLIEGYVDHWERLVGSKLVRVRYEDLVVAPEAIVAEVRAAAALEAVELSFPTDGATTSAASPTAKPDLSAPLHQAHVGMWPRWEPHLSELHSAIRESGLVERYQTSGSQT